EGAAIVDVGGESTRPGAAGVGTDEELRRIEPVLDGLAGEVPVSIDTSTAEVARRALELGAELVNDVAALRGDPELAGVVAESVGAAVAACEREATILRAHDVREHVEALAAARAALS